MHRLLSHAAVSITAVILLLCCSTGLTFGQKVMGTVTNEKNQETVIGATVLIKGTSNGTATDENGNYILENVALGSVIQFGYVGFVTEELTYNGESRLDVILREDDRLLDEMIIVGYGSQKRSAITGAVSLVKNDELIEAPVLRVEQALQGRTAGVHIAQNSGSPGAALTVRIRGTGTINNSDPLYIVDGMPVGGLDFLNIADIESINVLKDAASAAIYGARGANGVVLIKTFSGSKNQDGMINYHGYYGVQNAWKTPNLLNAREYAIISNEANIAAGIAPRPEFAHPDALGEGTDWVSELFQTAPISDHQLSFTGGSAKSAYAVSGNLFNQDGIVGGDKANFDRITGRINMTHQVKPWLNIGNTLNYIWLERNAITENSQFNSPMIQAMNIDPTTPVRKSDGTYAYSIYTDTDIANPLNNIAQTHNKWNTNRVLGSVFADINLFKGLVFRTAYSVDKTFAEQKIFYPRFDLSTDPVISEAPAPEKRLINSVVLNNYFWDNWQWENTLTYDFMIKDDNHFNAVLGTSAIENYYHYSGGSNTNLPSNNVDDAFIGNTIDPIESQTSFEGASASALNSYFARLNYDFMSKYFLTATIRTDGSSKFGINNRWGTFPSVSGGWIFTSDGILDDVFNFGKLRASWGQNGNDNIGDYGFSSVVNSGQNYVFGSGQVITNGSVPLNASNADLKWETSTQTNFGLDLELLDSRLQLITDYYIKNTSDMLYAIPVLSTAGTAPPVQNVASASNKGWELGANFRGDRKQAFQYSIGGNITFITNEVTNLGTGGEPINAGTIFSANNTVSRTDVGHPIGSFYGFVTDGIFQTQDEINNAAFQNENTAPGDIRFKDLNGDNIIDLNDQTYIGNPTPDFTYGLTGEASFKGFDFSMFWQGTQGNDLYNASVRYDFTMANKPVTALNRWTGPGTSNTEPRVSIFDPNQNARVSDRFVEDGSYLRLKNIQLGYSIPKILLSKIKVNSLRVYIGAQNLLTFTKYTGVDPEIGAVGGALVQGIDYGFYPQARTIMGGINLKF